MPLADSRRKVKVRDTKYELKTLGDLIDKSEHFIGFDLAEKKRFEDKTDEEIQEDIKKKRRKQYSQMVKLRTR